MWIAANTVLIALLQEPNRCELMAVRGPVAVVGLVGNLGIYVWLLIILPSRFARIFVAVTYPVVLLLITWAFAWALLGSCPSGFWDS